MDDYTWGTVELWLRQLSDAVVQRDGAAMTDAVTQLRAISTGLGQSRLPSAGLPPAEAPPTDAVVAIPASTVEIINETIHTLGYSEPSGSG